MLYLIEYLNFVLGPPLVPLTCGLLALVSAAGCLAADLRRHQMVRICLL